MVRLRNFAGWRNDASWAPIVWVDKKSLILQMSIQGHHKSALNSDTSDEKKTNNTTDCKVINNMLHFCIWFMDLDYQFWKIKWPNKIILYAIKCIVMQVTKP